MTKLFALLTIVLVSSCGQNKLLTRTSIQREALNIVLANNEFVKEAKLTGKKVHCFSIEASEKEQMRFLTQNKWILNSSLFDPTIDVYDDCHYFLPTEQQDYSRQLSDCRKDSVTFNKWDVSLIAYNSFKCEFGTLQMMNLKRTNIVGEVNLLVIFDNSGKYIRTLGKGFQT